MFSSEKPSRNVNSNSSALSMRSAYSPMIQIMDALASGSSRESRFSHSVDMILSYLFGYLRKMSFKTTIASCSIWSEFMITQVFIRKETFTLHTSHIRGTAVPRYMPQSNGAVRFPLHQGALESLFKVQQGGVLEIISPHFKIHENKTEICHIPPYPSEITFSRNYIYLYLDKNPYFKIFKQFFK